jgi:gamma-glutamylcyclotransferase (GGCT)/AIG2-like uncharacterized protein YtfP
MAASSAALFDLGMYPAAVPADHNDARVRGEVYEMANAAAVLHVLDEIEGYRPTEPDASLYTRELAQVPWTTDVLSTPGRTSITRRSGRAERIDSGDYLEYLRRAGAR